MKIENLAVKGYERVVCATAADHGFLAYVAMYDTTLGPALGCLSIRAPGDALKAVLRTAEGMTWKAAAANLSFGGGSTAILSDPHIGLEREQLAAVAEVLEMLGGAAIVTTGPGVTADDLRNLRTITPHVVGLSEEDGGSGDPSPHTARGVLEAIKASLEVVFENDAIEGRTVAIQGLGKVGRCLAALLVEAGGTVIGADVEAESAQQAAEQCPVQIVSPDEILTVPCDVFAPCAVPWILTAETIPRLRCRIVAGAANDQLGNERDAQRLHDRGILYAPDFVTNAGAVINMAAELDPEGYRPEEARRRVAGIRTRLGTIFQRAELSSITPEEAARAQARERIGNVRKANHHYGQ